MNAWQANLVAFCRGLRALGLAVGLEEERRALAALAAVRPARPEDLRSTLMAVLVKNPRERTLFLLAFEQWLLLLGGRTEGRISEATWLANVARLRRTRMPDIVWRGRGEEAEEAFATPVRGGASREEVLQEKDFAALTPEEADELARTAPLLVPPTRPGRRLAPSRRPGPWDTERILRRGVAAGEVIRLYRRAGRPRPLAVAFLVDVSGSMDPYTRGTLLFLHLLVRRRHPVDVLAFSTRVARVTDLLARQAFHRALGDIQAAVPGFAGGTRIDQAVETLAGRRPGPALTRRPVLVLVSDGLDTGEPDRLAAAWPALRRRTRAILWWTPVLADPGFSPEVATVRWLFDAVDQVQPAYNWRTLTTAYQALGRYRERPAAGPPSPRPGRP
ncbi:MAG: VWA domain-containing protein [Actinomycetia bacterium]|nr:VWA domain-containing protein [Actinomycetes bacterium]